MPSGAETIHETLSFEHHYSVHPERIFAAWADDDSRARWCGLSDGGPARMDRMEFCPGGTDVIGGASSVDAHISIERHYIDIRAGERIAFFETVRDGETPLGAALATIAIRGSGGFCVLTLTLQIASFCGPGFIEACREQHRSALHRLGLEIRRPDLKVVATGPR
ncbi:SRPBCC domain-containing protein [Rhizobiaceae bacterium BDR2-2]|uniref:SRPBCC domain-containing protein n=1 Tax=Ectorhizobium quercum TaxID=2965071 RepID=A0AAE3N3C8_9HYPH|nr:SRPBCC domain-containing protein [Ectorhizobium quercum]MCX8999162.1 SRPBCC domain-containing protein [Ectorhizobium quercum]